MITIREMALSDIPDAVAIWLASGKQEYTYLPMFQQLTTVSAQDVFIENIFNSCETWIVEKEPEPIAFLALDGDTLDRLYVHPDFQRSGIGSELLRFCLDLRPGGLRLFTHQENTRARQFYESFGFRAVRFGISPPPESVPDVEYVYGNPSAP
ncbi:MAG: GNAT family N-acetyltransferase [Pseudomonadota bacterium]